jgi:acyl-CoA synthetase (NDP forming)
MPRREYARFWRSAPPSGRGNDGHRCKFPTTTTDSPQYLIAFLETLAVHATSSTDIRLQSLFYPRSVALVGASERSPWSHMIHANLERLGYEGKVYSINKGGLSAHGYPGYTSCVSLPEAVDIAYLFVPVEAIVEAFTDVLAAGIKAIVILTSGFAEAGEQGAALQASLVQMAQAAGATFLGPNCLGFANLTIKASLTPAPNFLPLLPAKIGLVSQSGATNAQIADLTHDLNAGISIYIATGNEAMLDIAACVDFLVDDAHTQVIMVFAESIKDTATFSAAARRALAKRKAIVMLKVGTSELTALVAAAHTGSLVGDDQVFDAACRQLGIIRVHSLEDLVTTAALLAYTGPIDPPGIGVVSISGGACTLIADRAELYNVDLPAFAEHTKHELRAMLPSAEEPINPFDITGVAMRDPSLFDRALRAVSDDPRVGLVAAVYEMPWNEKWHKVPQIEAIGKALSAMSKPGVMLNQAFRPLTQKSRDIMSETGVPAVFGGIESVMKGLGEITGWSRRIASQSFKRVAVAPQTVSVRPQGEREVLDYLASRDIPVISSRLARTREDALTIAVSLDCPVALKIASPHITHKTDVGGVALKLEGAQAVGQAFDAIIQSVHEARPDATIEGVLVSPMRTDGVELLVGTLRDPEWGPVMAIGLGGIWVEALDDAQLIPLPATAEEIKALLERLRGVKLLQGFRGMPPVNLDKLAEIMAQIGDAALALGPNLTTLEVNPLWARESQIEALDGLAVWSQS